MKFSTRTRYALRALILLAKVKQGHSLSLTHIAETEHISAKYLEAIFADLKKAGLVASAKGANGGYQLAKPAGSLSILAVVSALEKTSQGSHCSGISGKQYCGVSCSCGVNLVVNKLNKSVADTLGNIKLKELVQN